MSQNLDLTAGSPLKKIIRFSLPLVGGSVFQQLYNFIDTLIIARLLGIQALAAVGAYYPLIFLVLGFIQGSCIGFSIPLAQHIGANDESAVKQDLLSGRLICLMMMVLLTPLMMVSAPAILVGLNTPSAILYLATIFTIISFAGIPANILYNYSASVLRAFGDSMTPFYFLISSLVLNIILALFFILVGHLGIASVAVATVISEFFAGILNLIHYRRVRGGHLSRGRLPLSLASLKQVALIGFPMGFEYAISSIGAIIMQDAINQLGVLAVAAQSAGDKIRQLFTLPMESVGMAIATYMAQNYGAQQRERLKQGLSDGALIQLIWSAVAFFLVLIFKRPMITLVLGLNHGRVFEMTDLYLTIISFFFLIHGLLMIFRNTLQGLGHSFYAIISGFGELAGRAIAAMLATLSFSFTAICYANQFAWGMSLIYCLAMTWWLFRHDPKLARQKNRLGQ